MRRLLATYALLCGALIGAWQCFAQVPMTGAGKGTPTVAASYQGPGDIISSPIFLWTTRCITTAYTGTVAVLRDSGNTTDTTVSCTAGGIISYSPSYNTNCSGDTCVVSTWTDQTAAGNCSGTCDVTQSTHANRPAWINSCSNGKPCTRWNAGTQLLSNAGGFLQSQPYTVSFVGIESGTSTNRGIALSNTGNGVLFAFGGSFVPNTVAQKCSSEVDTAATANNKYSVQMVCDSAGGGDFTYINGASTGTAAGNASLFGAFSVGGDAGNKLAGDLYEIGGWASALNSTQAGNLTTNQRSSSSGYNF